MPLRDGPPKHSRGERRGHRDRSPTHSIKPVDTDTPGPRPPSKDNEHVGDASSDKNDWMMSVDVKAQVEIDQHVRLTAGVDGARTGQSLSDSVVLPVSDNESTMMPIGSTSLPLISDTEDAAALPPPAQPDKDNFAALPAQFSNARQQATHDYEHPRQEGLVGDTEVLNKDDNLSDGYSMRARRGSLLKTPTRQGSGDSSGTTATTMTTPSMGFRRRVIQENERRERVAAHLERDKMLFSDYNLCSEYSRSPERRAAIQGLYLLPSPNAPGHQTVPRYSTTLDLVDDM